MRIIDADAFGMYLADVQLSNRGVKDDLCRFLDDVMDALDKSPTVETSSTVKYGKWLTPQNDTIRGQKFTCSVCGKVAYYPQPTRSKNWVKHCGYDYCPNCGAAMTGELTTAEK